MSTNIQRFYGNMEWFDSADQPDDIKQLPKEFQQAKALYKKNPEGNIEEIIKLLSPFVRARFIPSNISNWEELFKYPENEEVEVDATSVKVVGIQFEDSPIPSCKAEAYFDIKVTDQFSKTDLSEWQDQNDPFTDALVFYWDFPNNGDLEDLDFTFDGHQGAECIVVK